MNMQQNQEITPKADNKNPWAGLASYEDPETAERKLKFCGREDESYDVVKLIRDNVFVTLYGKSGIGKTSLLNAGVFPELREDQYTPFSLRLGMMRDEIQLQSYQTLIIDSVGRIVKRIEEVDVIPIQDNQQSVDYLWKYFVSHRFYDQDDNPVIPVIVFDQFEEVFRYNRDEAEILLRQLDHCTVNGSSRRYDVGVRFVLSIREDDLYRLEDSIDNCYLPALKRCRYRLRSLTEQGACDAILIPGEGLFREEEKDQIAQNVINIARNKEDKSISTNILSLVCNRLYVENQKTTSPYIGLSLVDSFIKGNPFERFYNEATRGFSDRAKAYIEEHFVDSTGRRNSIPESDFLINVRNGKELLEGENRILQRISTSSDGRNYRIELIHDSFCEPIAELKKKREQKKKVKIYSILAGIVLVCLGVAIVILSQRDTISQREKELEIKSNELEAKSEELEAKNVALETEIARKDSLHNKVIKANEELEQKQRELENKNQALVTANWEIKANQSRSVAAKAMDLIAEGDIMRGIALVMNILPDDINNPNRPFVPEAERALRAADDSIRNGRCECVMKGHLGSVTFAMYSDDWSKIATVSTDNTIRFWNLKTGEEYVSERIDIDNEGTGMAQLRNDPKYENFKEPENTESNKDGTFKICRAGDGFSVLHFKNVKENDTTLKFKNANYCGFLNDSIIMVSTAHFKDDTLQFYNLNGRCYADNCIHLPSMVKSNTVCVSPDKKHVFVGTYDGRSYIYKNPFNAVLYQGCKEQNKYKYALSNNKKYILTADGKIGKIEQSSTDCLKYNEINRVKLIATLADIFAISSDGTKIAYTGNNGSSSETNSTLHIMTVSDGSVVDLKFGSKIYSVAFSNDGKKIAVGCENHNIIMQNLETQQKTVFPGHKGYVVSLSFCNNDNCLISSSMDNTVRVWDINRQQELAAKRKQVIHAYNIRAAISPNMKYMAVYNTGVISIYDYVTNALLEVKQSPNSEGIVFSASDSYLYSIEGTNDSKRYNSYIWQSFYIPSYQELYNKYKYLRNYKLSDEERKEYYIE